jgi:hypothetical protein
MNTLVDYHERAQRHRPTSVDELFTAVDELAAQGLKPRDISTALKLPLASIIEHLFEEKQSWQQ